jgi:hypothetical protein
MNMRLVGPSYVGGTTQFIAPSSLLNTIRSFVLSLAAPLRLDCLRHVKIERLGYDSSWKVGKRHDVVLQTRGPVMTHVGRVGSDQSLYRACACSSREFHPGFAGGFRATDGQASVNVVGALIALQTWLCFP